MAPKRPQSEADIDAEMVGARFLLPRAWRRELAEAAAAQGISFADLMRLIARDFLRNRYPEPERAALDARPAA